MPLTDKEKTDYYVEFFKGMQQFFDSRRNYEWKFNLALWSAIAIFIGYMMTGNLATGVTVKGWAVIVVHSGMFLVYLFWSSGLHSANLIDRDWAFAYKRAVEDCIHGKPLSVVPRPPRHRVKALCSWSAVSQVVLTGGLLAISTLVGIMRLSAWKLD